MNAADNPSPISPSVQINWNQVFYFYQIAQHGSLKEAALALGFSSPTLSEHLNQLERSLGLSLFVRSHRKLTLTEQGNRLYQHARQMFDAGHRFLQTVAPLPIGASPISMALVPGPAVLIAYEFIRDYLAAGETVSMKLEQASHAEMERGLLNGQFDLGFSDCPSERKDLVSRRIFSSVIRFFVDAKLARYSLSKLLAELPVLLCASEASNQRLVRHVLEAGGISPRSLVISEYPALLYSLCQAGDGVGLFNEAAVRQSRYRLKPVGNRSRLPLEDRLYLTFHAENGRSASVERAMRVLKSFGGDL